MNAMLDQRWPPRALLDQEHRSVAAFFTVSLPFRLGSFPVKLSSFLDQWTLAPVKLENY